jgi:very-short-patch-repair endonuclease
MRPATILPLRLMALSTLQAGVVSRQQVASLGISDSVVRRLISTGGWELVTRGLYRLGPDTLLQRAWAGILLGGPQAVVGRLAAGFLHGLVATAPNRVTVYVPPTQGVRRDDARWQFVRGVRRGRGELPMTAPAQTVVDLAGCLGRDELIAVVARGVNSRLLLAPQVLELAKAQPRARGHAVLLDVLGAHVRGNHSPLEAHYDRDVERAHRLPRGTRQVTLVAGSRSDVVYDAYWLIVELDGVAFHLDKLADMERDNRHLIRGYRTLRFGWFHVTRDPCAVAAQVGAALAQAGWSGHLRPCPRCLPRPRKT